MRIASTTRDFEQLEMVTSMKPLLILGNPPTVDQAMTEPHALLRKVWRTVAPAGVRRRVFDLRRQRAQSRNLSRAAMVPLDKVTLGDQGGVLANQFAQLTGQWLYPSRPLAASPHVALLRDYEERGADLLAASFLPTTQYYQLLADCIRVTGRYRSATRSEEIVDVVRRFLDDFRTEKARIAARRPPDSNRPIELRPIAHSDCYQIIEGHHRAAMAYQLGSKSIASMVIERPVLTPLQALLLSGTWLQGRFELYQPVDSPELKQNWVLVRRCTDRLAKMRGFLERHELMPPTSQSYLDVGSAYGWFVRQMRDLGFAAYGTDRDPSAALVGVIAYGLDPAAVAVEDLVHFLRRQKGPYDVVSNMSVVHHYAMSDLGVGPDEVVSLLDRVTRRVLFFEMGEEHERWYRDALGGWNPDFIESFLRKHTSFTHIERLGVDEDALPPFEGNYGRMLFACWR